MILGDSFGAGQCVRQEDRFDEYLKMGGINVVNAASAGKEPLGYLAVLREYGKYIQPETVVMLYFEGNDFLNFKDDIANKKLRAYVENLEYQQGLVERQNEVDNVFKAVFEKSYDKWLARRPSNRFMEILKFYPVRRLIFPRKSGHNEEKVLA